MYLSGDGVITLKAVFPSESCGIILKESVVIWNLFTLMSGIQNGGCRM